PHTPCVFIFYSRPALSPTQLSTLSLHDALPILIQMTTNLGRLDPSRALKLFADWTDRIAAGELPASQPSRPQGVERNVVITLWDWDGPKDYLHDEVSTDQRNPPVNADGQIYGATEASTAHFPATQPAT